MNFYRKQIVLSLFLAALMVVGLWYGRPRSVGSACGGVEWDQVDVYNITLSQDGQEEALSVAHGDPLHDQLAELLENTYCTRQFNDQIPIERGFENVVDFAGGPDISIHFTWRDQHCTMLWTDEALFVSSEDLESSFKPLRRADSRLELAALLQEETL